MTSAERVAIVLEQIAALEEKGVHISPERRAETIQWATYEFKPLPVDEHGRLVVDGQ